MLYQSVRYIFLIRLSLSYRVLILLVWWSMDQPSFAQTKFERDSIWVKGRIFRYRYWIPPSSISKNKQDLMLFLHGRGEQGEDNEKQLRHGATWLVADSNQSKHPAILIFPQCPKDSYWSNVHIREDSSGKRHFTFQKSGNPTWAMEALLQLLDEIPHRFPQAKRAHWYVGGLSMGGSGTLELLARKPKKFTAAFAICGGAHPELASKIRRTPLWLFHGEKDDVMEVSYSRILFQHLQKMKANVRLTIFPEANHNAWDPTFQQKELLPWLFSQKKKSK